MRPESQAFPDEVLFRVPNDAAEQVVFGGRCDKDPALSHAGFLKVRIRFSLRLFPEIGRKERRVRRRVLSLQMRLRVECDEKKESTDGRRAPRDRARPRAPRLTLG